MGAPAKQADLSPWCRLAVGEAGLLELPAGYRIRGLAGSGEVVLHLYRPRWQPVITRRVSTGNAPAAYRHLVAQAWDDAETRTVVVTLDGEGFVRSFGDGAA